MYEQASTETPGLRDYLDAIRNRSWVVVACAVVVGLLVWLWASNRTLEYSAAARVLVGPTPVAALNQNNLVAPNLEREREVVRSIQVAEAVIAEVSSEERASDLLRVLDVRFRPDSDVMTLYYSSTSAVEAKAYVDAFASEYVELREGAAVTRSEEIVGGLETELDEIRAALSATLEEITQLESQRRSVGSDADLTAADRQSQLLLIDGQLTELRSTRSGLLGRERQLVTEVSSATSDERTRSPAATVLQLADEPTNPAALGTWLLTSVGALGGLIIGVVLAFAIERLDTTARKRSDVELVLDAPVLASVPPFGWAHRRGPASLIMLSEGRSAAVQRAREAFRRLRTAVQFLGGRDAPLVVLITSSQPAEGKSIVSANLAVALASSGKATALISADMRRPSLETLFAIDNPTGLSTLLATGEGGDIAVDIGVPGLTFIAAGPRPENPGELIASPTFDALIMHLRESMDVIIVDSPPVLSTADASTMVSSVDGVIVVVDSTRTETEELLQVRAEIDRAGGAILGTVLNKDRGGRSRLNLRRDRYAYEKAAAEGAA